MVKAKAKAIGPEANTKAKQHRATAEIKISNMSASLIE